MVDMVVVEVGGVQLMRMSSILLLWSEEGWCHVCGLGRLGGSRGLWFVLEVKDWWAVSLRVLVSEVLSLSSRVAFISPAHMCLPGLEKSSIHL